MPCTPRGHNTALKAGAFCGILPTEEAGPTGSRTFGLGWSSQEARSVEGLLPAPELPPWTSMPSLQGRASQGMETLPPGTLIVPGDIEVVTLGVRAAAGVWGSEARMLLDLPQWIG